MSFRWVVLGVLLISAFLQGRWSARPPEFLRGASPGAQPEAPEPGRMQPRGLGIESPDYVWNEAEVEALEFEGDIASGEQLFAEQCESCHSAEGAGQLDGSVPKIGGQHYNYLRTQLRDIAVGRRRNALPTMMVIVRSYSDEELGAVADYLSRVDWPETELE